MRDDPEQRSEDAAARRAVSDAGLGFIKAHEGFHARAVKLEDGRWLLGHSAVEADAEGREIAPEEAEDRLRRDLQPIEDLLNALVFAPLSQGQFDALASLGFSIGVDAFRECGVVDALNDGRPIDAAAVFDAWREAPVGDGMKPIDALVRRRAAEKAMFLALDAGPVAASSLLLRARAAARKAKAEARSAGERSTIDRMVSDSAPAARARSAPDPQVIERLARILPAPASAGRDAPRPSARASEASSEPPSSRFPPAPYPIRRGMAAPGLNPGRPSASGAQALRLDPVAGASWRDRWPWILGGGGLALSAVGVVNLRTLAAAPDGGAAEVGWALAAIGGLLALAAGGWSAIRSRPFWDE